MLNDLFAIERAMTASGIPVTARHPDIKDMAKGQALRARLKGDGGIAEVEIIPDAGRGAQWTLRDGQHNGFPGLKLGEEGKKGRPPNGLLSLDENALRTHGEAWDRAKTPADRRNEILRLLACDKIDPTLSSTWPNTGHRKRIRERLVALRPLENDPFTAAVPATFERFLLALEASPSFVDELIQALSEKAHSGRDEWIEPVREALVGRVPLVIDVAESDFDRDAGDPRQIGPVSAVLDAPADRVDVGAKDQRAVRVHWEVSKTSFRQLSATKSSRSGPDLCLFPQ